MTHFPRFNRPRLQVEDSRASYPARDVDNADRSEDSRASCHVEDSDDTHSIQDFRASCYVEDPDDADRSEGSPRSYHVEYAQLQRLETDLTSAASAVQAMRRNHSVVDLEDKNETGLREALLPSQDAICLYIQTRDPNIFSVDIRHGLFAEELTRKATNEGVHAWFEIEGVCGYLYRRHGEREGFGMPPEEHHDAADHLNTDATNVVQAFKLIQEAQPIIHLTYYPLKGYTQATIATFFGISLVVQSLVPGNHSIDISREPLARALETHAEDVGMNIPLEAEGIAACFVDSTSASRIGFLFAMG